MTKTLLVIDEVVALVAETIKRSKRAVVKENGIGTELAPIIISFNDDNQMIGFAQISQASKDPVDQYKRMAIACHIMRSVWHATKLAVVLEGYVSLRPSHEVQPDPATLVQRFADGDKTVSECISILMCDDEGVGSGVTIPYDVKIGRNVEWGDEYPYDDEENPSGAYSRMLRKVMLEVELIPFPSTVPVEAAMLSSSVEIHDLGFFVFCELIGEGQDWLDEIQYGQSGEIA